jgi:phosphoglycerate dehydrogenase-like enzyme
MVRVGVEEMVDDALLRDIAGVEIVRIPAHPVAAIEIDFWIAPTAGSVARVQWPMLRGVKVVQSLFAGVDALRAILPGDVVLCDARGVHDIPTAEWAVTAILAMQKYLPFYIDLQRRRDWDGKDAAEDIYMMKEGAARGISQPTIIDEVAGAVILIVGYGSIGQAIEARLAPFGAKFLRVARSERDGVAAVSHLDEMLPLADIVVMITPLTTETRHLMDARRIGRMKRGALLVNAGRGATVDTDALVDALERRVIRAAVDVVDPEPLPAEHPLWGAPNLLMTPHVATDSEPMFRRAYAMAWEQVERYVRSEALQNVVVGEY